MNAGGALTTYAYAPASNRLDAVDSTDIALDANGNTTAEGARSFTHTTQNRLFEVYDGGTLTVSYAYNGLGQRVTKTFPDATGRRYVYGTNGELLAETSLAGTVLIEYVYLNGTLIAQYQPDSDGDGQTNWEAETQGGQSARLDTDRDGLSDATELALKGTQPTQADSDGDGFGDGYEVAQQTDPLDPCSMPSLAQGDLNGDGELGIADALRLVGFAMELTEPTTETRAAADMNLDGEIDASDGTLLLRQIFGMAQPAQDQAADRSLTQRLLAWLLDTVIEPAHANPPGLGKVYYVHTDHLGTPVAMTDEVGIKVWGAVYDPFGAATLDEDPDGNGSAVALNVRFPGQYYDQETGLHYNVFRYYDPATGRYITSDPIGLGGGLNTYAYVGGNPLSKVDPDGLCEADPKTKECLEKIFGQGIDGVKVKENSFFAKLHGSNTIATTRKNRIYLNIGCDSFWSDCRLVLHEYYHVLRQWNTGGLTVPKYLWESAKNGYWNNQYEVEARDFAAQNLDKFKKCKEDQCSSK